MADSLTHTGYAESYETLPGRCERHFNVRLGLIHDRTPVVRSRHADPRFLAVTRQSWRTTFLGLLLYRRWSAISLLPRKCAQRAHQASRWPKRFVVRQTCH